MPIKANILVVGGAGYIGSHMVLALQEAGFNVIVVDNLSKGHAETVINAPLVIGNAGDKALMTSLLINKKIDAVMHFASYIEVGESVLHPGKYYQNNVIATFNLLESMLRAGVKRFIFSSTAAVYGEPLYSPIDEAHPLAPINPYGRSKVMVESMMQDFAKSDGLQYAILRYFNAAGADVKKRLWERHDPESHLIPIILQVAAGIKDKLIIYGKDYPTYDGTCVRDYVHVQDICQAHLLALQALFANENNIICNLGTGKGYSIQEVIDTAQRVTQCAIPIVEGKKRLGDPAILVADPTHAKKILNWQPLYPDLHDIIRHAWLASYANQLENA